MVKKIVKITEPRVSLSVANRAIRGVVQVAIRTFVIQSKTREKIYSLFPLSSVRNRMYFKTVLN